MHAGRKIGDNNLVWFDVDAVTLQGKRAIVLTARKHTLQGDIIGREFANREHVSALRELAMQIENGLADKEI